MTWLLLLLFVSSLLTEYHWMSSDFCCIFLFWFSMPQESILMVTELAQVNWARDVYHVLNHVSGPKTTSNDISLSTLIQYHWLQSFTLSVLLRSFLSVRMELCVRWDRAWLAFYFARKRTEKVGNANMMMSYHKLRLPLNHLFFELDSKN